MRILVHDFVGHPFQIQLSRELAARGHSVTHAYAIGLAGPKGRLNNAGSDFFVIEGVPLRSYFKKYSPLRRLLGHRHYARDVKHLADRLQPDVVLSGNTPVDIQAELLWYCRRRDVAFINWVQDVYSEALRFFLLQRYPWAAFSAHVFEQLERWVALKSDMSILIADAFQKTFAKWNVPETKTTVVENWAPLEETPQYPRENAWRRDQHLPRSPVLLYCGTLGVKHRPDLLYLLADKLRDECTVVVITDGLGSQYLSAQPRLTNLVVLPFQPYDELPKVLASADVLIATLEAGAGQFAVPSKILTYLCAGRAILFAGPSNNLAASIITKSGAGLVVDPGNPEAFVAGAKALIRDERYRTELGRHGRTYATTHFDIARIAERFEELLYSAYANRGTSAALRSPVTIQP